MTVIRNILIFFVGLLVTMLVVTVVGLVVDPANAQLWTQGIMWTLLGSLVVAPVSLFVDFSSAQKSPTPEPAQESSSPASAPSFEPEPVPFDWPREIDQGEHLRDQ